jgi:hypothetical protein
MDEAFRKVMAGEILKKELNPASTDGIISCSFRQLPPEILLH